MREDFLTMELLKLNFDMMKKLAIAALIGTLVASSPATADVSNMGKNRNVLV